MRPGPLGLIPTGWLRWCSGGRRPAPLRPMTSISWKESRCPSLGKYDVLLNGREEAVCILRTTKVYVTPFDAVTAGHARKEGEGDKSLGYWRQVHEAFFTQCLQEAGLAFTPETRVVCEEFEVAFRP